MVPLLIEVEPFIFRADLILCVAEMIQMDLWVHKLSFLLLFPGKLGSNLNIEVVDGNIRDEFVARDYTRSSSLLVSPSLSPPCSFPSAPPPTHILVRQCGP